MLLSKTGRIVYPIYVCLRFTDTRCFSYQWLVQRIRVQQSSINFNVLILPIMRHMLFTWICSDALAGVSIEKWFHFWLWFLRFLSPFFLYLYHVLTIPTFYWFIRPFRFTRFCPACPHACKPISCFVSILLIWMYAPPHLLCTFIVCIHSLRNMHSPCLLYH